jgi:hypothetical protein
MEGDEAILGTPIPIGTPGSLDSALGSNYKGFISAYLSGAAFDVQPTVNQEYSLSEHRRIDWVWSILPNKEGPQILNLIINVRWGSSGDDKAQIYPVYRQSFSINVGVPPFERGESIAVYNTIYAILTFILGGLTTWGVSKIYSWVFRPRAVKAKKRQQATTANSQVQVRRDTKARTKAIL